MKLVKLGMVCGALLLAACGGDDGTPGAKGDKGDTGPAGEVGNGAESINGLSPTRAFVGRTLQVSISGNNTEWSETAKPAVDFGAGITVNSVEVASPTALLVNVTVDPSAPAGAREVKAGEQVFKGFQVLEPLSAEVVAGDAAQGSKLYVSITNLDFVENPFNTATDQDGAYIGFGAGVFDGAELADNVYALRFQAGVRDALMEVAIDVNAAAKAYDLVTISGTSDDNLASSAVRGGLSVAARTPVAITAAGVPVQLASYYSSQLFVFEAATAGPALINFAGESATVTLIPEGGSWEDAVSGSVINAAAGDKYYVVVMNDDSDANTGTLSVRSLSGTVFPEAEPNNTLAEANAVTALPVRVEGEIVNTGTVAAPVSDIDTFSFTAEAGATYFIDQIARGDDGSVDASLTIIGPDGEEIDLVDNAEDYTKESYVLNAGEAGTYTVQVRGYYEDGFFGPYLSTGEYALYISKAP